MQVVEQRKSRIKKVRDHDYIYDPNYVVSHYKDFYREARKSAINASQFTIHPVYHSMFSDLNRYKRVEMVCHPNARLPKHVEIAYRKNDNQSPNVPTSCQAVSGFEGKQRALFFSAPKVAPTPQVIQRDIEIHTAPPDIAEHPVEQHGKVSNKAVQTLYRESSAQTSPCQTDYFISKKCKEPPEILLIDDVVTSHEGNILSVHRQRVRREWLKRALDFKVLTQLDKFEYNFREKEIEKMLILEEEKYGLEILSTVNKDKLNNIWNVGTLRLQKKIKQIRHNKERELRKIESKRNKLNEARQKTSHSAGSYVRKPLKLAVNLNYLPEEDEFKYQPIDLNPKVTNKFKVCDKFMKKRENNLSAVKRELKKILEPEDVISEDSMSYGEVEEEKENEIEKEEMNVPEVEKADKQIATDYLMYLLHKGCEDIEQADIEGQFEHVKRKVVRYILEALNKELDNVMEERMFREIAENSDGGHQDNDVIEKIRVKRLTSQEQMEMYLEVTQIAQEVSSSILQDMFDEVSKNVESTCLCVKNVGAVGKEGVNESHLAEMMMDVVLPLVVSEIEKKQSVHHSHTDTRVQITESAKEITRVHGEVKSLPISSEIEPSVDIDMNQAMSEVLKVVHKAGKNVLEELFTGMSQKMSSVVSFSDSDDSETSILSRKSGISFVKDIIMHELLPEVVEELRKKKAMSSTSMGYEEFDDALGNMIKVVGVIHKAASSVLDDIIQESTQAPFLRIERTQSTTSTKLKRRFIKDIIQDTLMPQVVEEVRNNRKATCSYLTDEDEQLSGVLHVIQGAASEVLSTIFTGKICTCMPEEPIESYVQSLIISPLPKHIRAELDPKYYFDLCEDTNEKFVWSLVVDSLPKYIREELQSPQDVKQINKVVGYIQQATSEIFKYMFDEVSERIISQQIPTLSPSDESFLNNFVMNEIVSRVMALVSQGGSQTEISKVIERVASGMLNEMFAEAKCEAELELDRDTVKQDSDKDE